MDSLNEFNILGKKINENNLNNKKHLDFKLTLKGNLFESKLNCSICPHQYFIGKIESVIKELPISNYLFKNYTGNENFVVLELNSFKDIILNEHSNKCIVDSQLNCPGILNIIFSEQTTKFINDYYKGIYTNNSSLIFSNIEKNTLQTKIQELREYLLKFDYVLNKLKYQNTINGLNGFKDKSIKLSPIFNNSLKDSKENISLFSIVNLKEGKDLENLNIIPQKKKSPNNKKEKKKNKNGKSKYNIIHNKIILDDDDDDERLNLKTNKKQVKSVKKTTSKQIQNKKELNVGNKTVIKLYKNNQNSRVEPGNIKLLNKKRNKEKEKIYKIVKNKSKKDSKKEINNKKIFKIEKYHNEKLEELKDDNVIQLDSENSSSLEIDSKFKSYNKNDNKKNFSRLSEFKNNNINTNDLNKSFISNYPNNYNENDLLNTTNYENNQKGSQKAISIKSSSNESKNIIDLDNINNNNKPDSNVLEEDINIPNNNKEINKNENINNNKKNSSVKEKIENDKKIKDKLIYDNNKTIELVSINKNEQKNIIINIENNIDTNNQYKQDINLIKNELNDKKEIDSVKLKVNETRVEFEIKNNCLKNSEIVIAGDNASFNIYINNFNEIDKGLINDNNYQHNNNDEHKDEPRVSDIEILKKLVGLKEG